MNGDPVRARGVFCKDGWEIVGVLFMRVDIAERRFKSKSDDKRSRAQPVYRAVKVFVDDMHRIYP